MPLPGSAEIKERAASVLPGADDLAHEGGMAGSRDSGRDRSFAIPALPRVATNAADKFRQRGVFLTEYGFVPILKELSATAMPLVASRRMAGEKTGRRFMKRRLAGLQKKMSVIAGEGPCITGRANLREHLAHSCDKTVFVEIVPEDQSALDAANNDGRTPSASRRAWRDIDKRSNKRRRSQKSFM